MDPINTTEQETLNRARHRDRRDRRAPSIVLGLYPSHPAVFHTDGHKYVNAPVRRALSVDSFPAEHAPGRRHHVCPTVAVGLGSPPVVSRRSANCALLLTGHRLRLSVRATGIFSVTDFQSGQPKERRRHGTATRSSAETPRGWEEVNWPGYSPSHPRRSTHLRPPASRDAASDLRSLGVDTISKARVPTTPSHCVSRSVRNSTQYAASNGPEYGIPSEMTGSAQATAAVPAVSGEDDDRVGPSLAGVPGEVPTRVPHHLKQ